MENKKIFNRISGNAKCALDSLTGDDIDISIHKIWIEGRRSEALSIVQQLAAEKKVRNI